MNLFDDEAMNQVASSKADELSEIEDSPSWWYPTVIFQKISEDAVIPSYAHGPESDAGMDLTTPKEVSLELNVPTLVKLGFKMQLPEYTEAQIRSRSGLALRGVTVVNQPGTVDPGYRGEVGVILKWNGHGPSEHTEKLVLPAGTRIAQMVFAAYQPVKVLEGEVDTTLRGEGGFGSTGL